MKVFAAVLLLALLAFADARTMLKKSTAKAASVAYAGDGSIAKANADSHAKDGGTAKSGSLAAADDGSYAKTGSKALAKDEGKAIALGKSYAKDGSIAKTGVTAVADDDSLGIALGKSYAKDGSIAKTGVKALADDDSLAIALGKSYAKDGSVAWVKADADADDHSYAKAIGLATATKWGVAGSSAKAKADKYGVGVAKSIAKAKDDGHATSKAGVYAHGGYASAVSKALADGGYSKAKATAKAIGSDDDYKGYFYGHHKYYYGLDSSDDEYSEKYFPYYFNPFYYHSLHYGYYAPEIDSDSEEETEVHYYDPALVAYYTHLIYDFGCYEGKHYRCKYDDSCGKCPYGHFCGEVKQNVCKEVSVWVKKCADAKAPVAKQCVPVLTPCGTEFCKYNQKCATDYFWCKAPWCAPKYSCVDVEAPKKCVWVVVADEYGFEKKVEKCTDYVEEACEAGKNPCPIGYECSDDPCTYVETKVKKCEDEPVPVCMPYDIPTYKDLYNPCGPGFCHPGYKCEAYEHKSCVKPVVVVKPEEPKYVHILPIKKYHDDDEDLHIFPIDHEDCDDDEDCDYYSIPHPDHKADTKSTASSSAVSIAGPKGSYSNIDLSATGSGKAYGSADAKTEDSGAWSKGLTSKDGSHVYTGSKAKDGHIGIAKGSATYDDGSD